MVLSVIFPQGIVSPLVAARVGECDPVEVLIGTDDIVGAVCELGQALGEAAEAAKHLVQQSSETFVDLFEIVVNADSDGAPCQWYSLDEPPGSPLWGTNSPSEGHLEGLRCGDIAGDGFGGGGALLDYQFVRNDSGQPGLVVAPPPPTPFELAQRAMAQITIPQPAIGVRPDRTKQAVNLWTWLWIDNPGPQTTVAAAGGVSVSLTAVLASTTWSLGEPAPTGGPYAPGPAVTITCQGTGSAPPVNYDWKAEPPCGHKYTWMSARDRTGGSGTWPITATSNWNVTWQSNTGVSGSAVLNSSSTDALEVGEYRTVLVQGPGG